MTLLDTHIGFIEALRSAGLSVSLAEGLDAIEAMRHIGWGDREVVRTAYAATLVKKQTQRVTFDAIFDLYYPRLVGAGAAGEPGVGRGAGQRRCPDRLHRGAGRGAGRRRRSGQGQRLQDLAVEAVGRFGAMPGRGPGLSSWSAYTALQRVSPQQLIGQLVAGLMARGDDRGGRRAGRRSPRRHVHRPGRGRRPPPDRGGEGARARRQHRGPADHRPARLHRRPPLRPGGDAARDLPARAPAGDPADQAAARAPARSARLPPYGPSLPVHRRRPDRDAPPARSGRTAPSSSSCATSAGRSPTSRSSRCCWSSRCASSSTRCGRSPSSTTCTR